MDKPVKKITSFKKLPPVSPASTPDTLPKASQPSASSKNINKDSLTDFEKTALEKLGVQGDVKVLPANVAEKIEALTAGSGNVINFDDLPEEKKKELAKFIDAGSAVKEEPQQQTSQPRINLPQPVVIDDLEDKAKEETQGVTKIDDKAEHSVICPHCGWDTRKKELTEVTDDDKANFVQSLLGGLRFKKTYSLFGGKLRIVYRTLTTYESDMAYKQVLIDAQKDIHTKAIADSSFYWRTLMAYRAMMAVERVESDINVVEVPPVSEIEADPAEPPNTKIFALFDSLVEQIMPNEALRNAISHTYTEFNALCEKLQSMAESKDFWNAIK